MHSVSGIDSSIKEFNKYLILTPLLKNRTKPIVKCLLKDLIPIYLAILSSEASYISFGKFDNTLSYHSRILLWALPSYHLSQLRRQLTL